MKYLIFIALSIDILYAMDRERNLMDAEAVQLENACIKKSNTENSQMYTAKIITGDGSEIEYSATQFSQGSDKGSKTVCTRTKIGRLGSEITNDLNKEWFERLKSLYEKQNKKN